MWRSEIEVESVSSKKEPIIHDSKIISKSVLVTHTKNRSNSEISNYVTNNKKSNQTGSKISTSFLASLEHCQYITTITNLDQTENQNLDEPKKINWENWRQNNKTKFTVPKKKLKKTKSLLEDQNNSNSHDLECVEFLDSLNYESVDINEEYINYLDQSIWLITYQNIAKRLICSNLFRNGSHRT